MPITPLAAVAAFRSQVRRAEFVAGMLKALLVVAVGLAVTLLVVRLAGGHLPPTWWWSGLLVPIVAFALWRARAERIGIATAAVHLDRRLGLDGLLLSCSELGQGAQQGIDVAFRARVDRGLRSLPGVMPKLRWRSILPLPLCATLLAVFTAFLPAPPVPPGGQALPAFQAEVARLNGQLRDLFDRGHVPEEVEAELRDKLAELGKKLEAGQMPEWRDLDDLDQRIAREQLMQLAAEARGGAPAATGESRARSMQSLAAAAKALAAMGLLDKLPAQLAAALQAARQADGSFALDKMMLDPAQMKALVEAFADALGELGGLEGLALDAEMLGDLRGLLEGLGAGAGAGSGPGEGYGEGVGRGGLQRGPGHAALSLTESAKGGADQAMPLPQSRGLPNEWVPIGSERIEPVVAPVTNTGQGGAAEAGTGGATWQLDYAPRHREVLQKFFGKEGR